MKHLKYCFFLLLAPIAGQSQNEGNELLQFEQRIDHAIVACDLPFLETAYAEDFRFKHGTGHVDSRSSWLKNVKESKGKFISREIDSVEVEIHAEIGITNGRLSVHRYTDKGQSRYIVKYVRAYRRRGKNWEMFMHRTVYEKDN